MLSDFFSKSNFPYKQSSSADDAPVLKSNDYNPAYLDELFDHIKHSNHTNQHIHDRTIPANCPNMLPIFTSILPYPLDLNYDTSPSVKFQNQNHMPNTNHTPQVIPPIRKSTRHVKPTSYLHDYHCNPLSNIIHNSEVFVSISSSSCKYPLSSFMSYDSLSSTHKLFILNMSTIIKPKSYENAICDENWRDVIKIELTALIKTNTWSLVPLPS